MRYRLALLVAIVCWSAAPQPARAQAPIGEQIIVKFVPSKSAPERRDLRTRSRVSFVRHLPMPGVEVVASGTASERPAALTRLRANPSIAWAEANSVVSAATADPLWSSLWGLENTGQTGGTAGADISAPEAWAYGKGAGMTVGVVDSGVQVDHPDLQLTGNPRERGDGRETDGIDNDGNGYVDDWQGWNWLYGNNDPFDENSHGTHVAGTVAAAENTIGVVGVAPQARVLPLRVLNRNGFGGSDLFAAGLAYAGDLGLRVVNASIGSNTRSLAVEEAIATHPDTLYVVAAGNGGGRGAAYPCALPQDNIVCVGASTHLDWMYTLSYIGAPSVDLLAPGLDINSTVLESGYGLKQGTSMASPHVAGAAALLFSAVADLTVAQAKAALLDSVDRPQELLDLSVSGGRLNAAAALAAAGATPLPTPPAAPGGLVATAGAGQVLLDWDDNSEPDLAGYRVYRAAADGTWSTAPLASPILSSYTATALANGVAVTFRVTAVGDDGEESAPSPAVTATPVAVSCDALFKQWISSRGTTTPPAGAWLRCIGQLVKDSPNYRRLSPTQKAAVDRLLTVLADRLEALTPKLSPLRRAIVLAGYRLTVDALVRSGWLSTAQTAPLKSLVSTL